jgi:putative ABC transport system permease protein
MRIPLLAGRELSETDGPQSARVVLISAATASHFWPGRNPIGKHIKSAGESQWRTVVGVVGDVRQFRLSQGLPDFVPGAIYMPYAQSVREDGEIPAAMTLLVKSAPGAAQIAADLRGVAQAQNPDVPVGPVQSLEEIVAGSISDFRSTIRVFLSFAGAAILLAAIGIYGVLSYWVAQRTYEIGVRAAMGATRPRIVWMIMTQGLRLTVYGIAAGAMAAFALTRFLSGLLYGVGAADPLTFPSVIAIIFAIAAAAAALPAWRAARIDPVCCLRAD